MSAFSPHNLGDAEMAKIKCPYTYPHRSRYDKVQYIVGIGGYTDRYSAWPIEFNVAAYRTDFSFDNLWRKYYLEHTPAELAHDPEACTAYYRLAKRLHGEHEDSLWGWGQEGAYRSLNDGDCYRMLWDGTMVDVKLELHGRCGKHLVIAEFNGHKLEGLTDSYLQDDLMRQRRTDGYEHVEYDILQKGNYWSSWSNEDLNLLYKYVRQCEVDFTTDKASAEVEYQGAFCFFNNIVNPAWKTLKEEMASHDEAVGAAKVIHSYLMAHDALDITELDSSFLVLCTAAGITAEELE